MTGVIDDVYDTADDGCCAGDEMPGAADDGTGAADETPCAADAMTGASDDTTGAADATGVTTIETSAPIRSVYLTGPDGLTSGQFSFARVPPGDARASRAVRAAPWALAPQRTRHPRPE